jgi:hypothetical protein
MNRIYFKNTFLKLADFTIQARISHKLAARLCQDGISTASLHELVRKAG